jgi:ketosteroid isomerase-like protein
MKAAALTTISGAIAASLCATAQATPSDDAQIRALESRFAASFNAKDVNSIMKAYVPDNRLVVFDVVPPRQYVGAEAYRKDWEGFLSGLKGPVKFDITDLYVLTDGPLGYSHSIQHVQGTDAKDQPIDLTVRVTDVYRKIKGSWLIVHEHVSVPVDLNTGKPDLSLSHPLILDRVTKESAAA